MELRRQKDGRKRIGYVGRALVIKEETEMQLVGPERGSNQRLTSKHPSRSSTLAPRSRHRRKESLNIRLGVHASSILTRAIALKYEHAHMR